MFNLLTKSLFILCISLSLVHCGGSDNPSPTDPTPPPVIIDNPDTPTDTEIDTDGDGLSDAEEISLGTDIALIDSDEDGLTDFEETHTNTDPILPDSDGDGILDGEDSNESTITHDTGVEIVLTAKGSQIFSVSVHTADDSHKARNGLPISDVWEIHYHHGNITLDAEGELITEGFEKAMLTLPLPLDVKSSDGLTLAVWNPIINQWELHNEPTFVDLANHTIRSDVPHFSTWAVVNHNDWINAITTEIIDGTTEQQIRHIITRVERWPDYLLKQEELNQSLPYLPEFTAHDIRDARNLIKLYDNALRPLADFPGTHTEAAKEQLSLLKQTLVEPFALSHFTYTHPSNLATTLQFVNDYEIMEEAYYILKDETDRAEYLAFSPEEITNITAGLYEIYERTAYSLLYFSHYYRFADRDNLFNTELEIGKLNLQFQELQFETIAFLDEYTTPKQCEITTSIPQTSSVAPLSVAEPIAADVFISNALRSSTVKSPHPSIKVILGSTFIVWEFFGGIKEGAKILAAIIKDYREPDQTKDIEELLAEQGINVDEEKCDCPPGWKQSSGSSTILGDNMRLTGYLKPANGFQAHHIVAKSDALALPARKVLTLYCIDIDISENGVWLPHHTLNPEYIDRPEANHAKLHSKEFKPIYMKAVNSKIQNSKSKSGVLINLIFIKNKLRENQFP